MAKNAQKSPVDEAIMAELLEQPGVKEHADQFSPEWLEWFKGLLISQGIYAKYVKEREGKK